MVPWVSGPWKTGLLYEQAVYIIYLYSTSMIVSGRRHRRGIWGVRKWVVVEDGHLAMIARIPRTSLENFISHKERLSSKTPKHNHIAFLHGGRTIIRMTKLLRKQSLAT